MCPQQNSRRPKQSYLSAGFDLSSPDKAKIRRSIPPLFLPAVLQVYLCSCLRSYRRHGSNSSAGISRVDQDAHREERDGEWRCDADIGNAHSCREEGLDWERHSGGNPDRTPFPSVITFLRPDCFFNLTSLGQRGEAHLHSFRCPLSLSKVDFRMRYQAAKRLYSDLSFIRLCWVQQGSTASEQEPR